MSWGYRPQLDGLRALAIYLVLLEHAGLRQFSGGFIGVDLFFVLSGFLVTNVIWNEIDADGRFRLGAFYARRVRRLLPAAVVVVVATCLLQVLVTPLASRIDFVDDARASLLYYANWHFLAENTDYFAQGGAPSPFLHFWSLSIEEQFYIVFPLLCLALTLAVRRERVAGRAERLFGVALGVLLGASVVLQVLAARDDVNGAYFSTQTRAYQLLAGAVLAIVLRGLARRTTPTGEPEGHRVARRASVWPWAVGSAVGLVGLLVLGTNAVEMSQSNRGLAATVTAVALIGGATRAPRFVVARFFTLPTVRYLGQISYGTYLWHWPVTLAVRALVPTSPLVTAAIVAAVGTALAALSFQVLETPIRRAKPLNRVPWPTVVTGLAVSALVAAVVVSPVLQRPHVPRTAELESADGQPIEIGGTIGKSLRWTQRAVPRDLPIADLREDDGDLGASCEDSTPASCVVVDGPATEPLVVLVGDSHAGMLLPALRELAQEHGFRLSSNIRNKCAWIQGIHNRTEPDYVNDPCREQRADFYDTILPAMDADLVIMIQRSRDGADALLTDVVADDAADHPDETHDQMFLRTATATVAKVEAAGAATLIVHSVLTTNGWEVYGGDPLNCLSVATVLGDCAVTPVDPPRLDSLFDYLAVSDPLVHTVEFRDDYCPARILCAPVVDGTVTWKDRAHLSTDYLIGLRDKLWARLLGSGAFDDLTLD